MKKNLTDIQQSAKEHRTATRPELWDRIESKLDAKSDKKKSRIYLSYALAAMFIAVLSTTLLFSTFLTADHEETGPYIVSLDIADEQQGSPIYTAEQVRAFKKAYKKVN